MGDLVGKRTELLETVLFANKRYELSYYRNEVLHIFVDEAIVCSSLYACFKIGHNPDAFGRRGGLVQSNRTVPRSELAAAVQFLSQLLKSEFIYQPGSLDDNMTRAIARLEVPEEEKTSCVHSFLYIFIYIRAKRCCSRRSMASRSPRKSF